MVAELPDRGAEQLVCGEGESSQVQSKEHE